MHMLDLILPFGNLTHAKDISVQMNLFSSGYIKWETTKYKILKFYIKSSLYEGRSKGSDVIFYLIMTDRQIRISVM